MVTPELIDYIKKQVSKNVPREKISYRLILAGWYNKDIEEGLEEVIPTPKSAKEEMPVIQKSESKPEIHKYIPFSTSTIVPKIEVKEPEFINVEEPVTLPKVKEIKIETLPLEIKTEPIKVEPPKIWTPKVLKFTEEIIPKVFPVVQEKPVEKFTYIIPTPEKIVVPVAVSTPVTKSDNPIPVKRMSAPTLKNKPQVDNIVERAMMSSYSRDLSSAILVQEKVSVEKQIERKSRLLKWLVFILIACLISGTAFAFFWGYIRVPSFNFNFVKRDSKSILLSTPAVLGALKYYKTETNITLSSPLFSDIASGLISGEAVNSKDKDSISINISGQIDQSAPPFFSSLHTTVIQSSLLKDSITSSLKYNDTTSFLAIPDLSQVLGKNAPKSATVSIPKGQLNLLVSTFNEDIRDMINKIDIYDIQSKGMSPFVYNEVSQAFKEFITSSSVVEKDIQKINNLDTYHYQLNANNQTTRKLFSDLSDIFITTLPTDIKTDLIEQLGSITINSFDFWVGKKDSNLYQYKFILTIPLSKVIGLLDKGIAGSQVSLSWQTRFYDFDVSNNIKIPKDTVPVADFVKSVSDMRIKDAIDSFKPSALSFYNTTGKYGSSSNTSGSCEKANTGSLFSSLGQNKGASIPVGDIAGILNIIIKLDSRAQCFSTSKSWAIALPLASDLTSFYCTDNKSPSVVLTKAITGPVCK